MSHIPSIINYNSFKFIVLPGSDPDPKYLDYYNSAYKCWHDVWIEAHKELGYTRQLHSDDFTRQTEIDCIFYGKECIALLFLKWADFKSNATQNDSYFKLWTKNEFDQLIKYGPEVLIISNTTVAKEWRGKDLKFPIKELILYLTIQRFLISNSPAMTAVTRNTRGIDKMIEHFGAVVFKKNIKNFNDTDLVNLGAFYKKDMTEGVNSEVIKIGRKLWNEQLVVNRDKLIVPSNPTIIPKKTAA